MRERMDILEQIEAGEISVEEGVRRLETQEVAPDSSKASVDSAISAPTVTRPAWTRIVWQAVFGAGIILLAWGGYLLVNAYTREGALVWGWVLFALGVLTMGLGWWLRETRWFYLRVREEGGHEFALALPLPLGLVAWLLKVVGPFVPQFQDTGADELILAMRDELRNGSSFVLDVDEGEDGEEVRMYFC